MIIAVTVTGKDRPGIIAELTKILYRSGGNLEDASMTILEGEFAMIFLAELKSKQALERFVNHLAQAEEKQGLVISVKAVKHPLARGEKHPTGTLPWIVSVLGKDCAGIVYRVSKLLADKQINITDLNSKIIGRGPATTYALVLETDVPRKPQIILQLKCQFEKLEKKLKVKITFKPLESSSF